MDGAKIIELVQSAREASPEGVDLYGFAAQVAEAQREQTAQYFEQLGFPDIAAKVRAS